jgi:hypothetical protein
VGEGVKLAELRRDLGRGRNAFEALEPGGGEFGQKPALVRVKGDVKVSCCCCLDPAESHVGGEVALTQSTEHLTVHLMVPVAAKGAIGSLDGVVFVIIESVVCDQKGTSERGTPDAFDPSGHGGLDLRGVTNGEISWQ